MEIDLRELPLAIDFLTVDAHDPQLGAQQRGDAEVRRALHPGLEEERTVMIEQPFDSAARFAIGQRRAVPLYVAGTPGSGERGLENPGRRRFPEDAVELR